MATDQEVFRSLVAAGMMPALAKMAISVAGAGQRLAAGQEIIRASEVTTGDIEQARLWWPSGHSLALA
jgi:hypothetical protein